MGKENERLCGYVVFERVSLIHLLTRITYTTHDSYPYQSLIRKNTTRIFDLQRSNTTGTPQWMAPECMLDDSFADLGPSIDVFSLAVVMWECLKH